jgi:hypothetical protein
VYDKIKTLSQEREMKKIEPVAGRFYERIKVDKLCLDVLSDSKS